MIDHTTYLFIDGGYARRIYRKAMKDVFDVEPEPDPRRLTASRHGEQPYFRAYFYDCLDDTKRPAETDADFETRVSAMKSYFDAFSRLNGVHVRLGTATGKKVRQKEVDVLLAVDMLTHGFNRNMTHAVLLSGDFRFSAGSGSTRAWWHLRASHVRERFGIERTLRGGRPRNRIELGHSLQLEYRLFHAPTSSPNADR
jgi:hypothetical protein